MKDIPNLYKKLLDDPAYQKLIKTAPDSEKPKIEAALKKFMDDFTNNVFTPLGKVLADADASKKLKEDIIKRSGKTVKNDLDFSDVEKIIKESTGKK